MAIGLSELMLRMVELLFQAVMGPVLAQKTPFGALELAVMLTVLPLITPFAGRWDPEGET